MNVKGGVCLVGRKVNMYKQRKMSEEKEDVKQEKKEEWTDMIRSIWNGVWSGAQGQEFEREDEDIVDLENDRNINGDKKGNEKEKRIWRTEFNLL